MRASSPRAAWRSVPWFVVLIVVVGSVVLGLVAAWGLTFNSTPASDRRIDTYGPWTLYAPALGILATAVGAFAVLRSRDTKDGNHHAVIGAGFATGAVLLVGGPAVYVVARPSFEDWSHPDIKTATQAISVLERRVPEARRTSCAPAASGQNGGPWKCTAYIRNEPSDCSVPAEDGLGIEDDPVTCFPKESP